MASSNRDSGSGSYSEEELEEEIMLCPHLERLDKEVLKEIIDDDGNVQLS